MLTESITRKYTSTDEAALIHLWRKVFPNDPPHNAPKQVIAEKQAVDELIFVSYCADHLAAACMAGYDGHRGWLYAVAVDPDYHRNGLGQSVVNYAVDVLKDLGCHKVNLQIRSDNIEVQAFYDALGFAVEPRLSMCKHI
ncbi:MAG: ribosomal protein S18 acetylase RimI-like enzyme [Saprospiraceae bacterium]|jgi:ribosomal protein S18 acetylase RimI-like enzyme